MWTRERKAPRARARRGLHSPFPPGALAGMCLEAVGTPCQAQRRSVPAVLRTEEVRAGGTASVGC